MARRTKEEAAATRERILDAAVEVFSERGMAQTSLQQIADAASVSRGAIQWHFGDKDSLASALMKERVIRPVRRALAQLEPVTNRTIDPVARLETLVMVVLESIMNRPQVRRIAELTMLRAESFDRTDAIHRLRLDCMVEWARRAEVCIVHAQGRGLLRVTVNAKATGMILCAMLHGVIRSWLLDPSSFDLRAQGNQMIDVFLNGIMPVRTENVCMLSACAA